MAKRGFRNVDRTTIRSRLPFPATTLLFGLGFSVFLSASVGHPSVQLSQDRILRPGTTIRVTWTSLPPETEEFELLLGLESPASGTVRLTECRDPALASLTWRVPHHPAERARILLRLGRRGREILWARSEPFSIARSDDPRVERLRYRRGEIWITGETSLSRKVCDQSLRSQASAIPAGRSSSFAPFEYPPVGRPTLGGTSEPILVNPVRLPSMPLRSRSPQRLELRI